MSHQQQAVNYGIKGVVIDSVSQKALDYATVALKNDKNESVKTILTKDDGSFAFADIKPGKYSVSVIGMGYKTKVIDFELNEDRDLGQITIAPQSTSLAAVTVIADKPLIKMDIDKISYDLQADPESKVNSVLEMMRKVPMLSLDYEDNIQLKGSGNYRILINGKPSAMLEKSPKDILRSMPASTIQNIEVITNPPAKYDGEGLTGIINIVTVKKIDNGYNGNANFSQRFPAGGPNLGSSFNFKQGKWGVSARVGGALYHDPLSTNLNNRVIVGNAPSELLQTGGRQLDSRNAYSSVELSYEIDTLNLVSGEFSYNLGSYDLSGFLNSSLINPSIILESYRLVNNNTGSRNGTDASVNYQLGFKKNKQQLLTLSYRYLKYFDDRGVEALLSDRIDYLLPDYYQFNEGGSEEQTFQLDYVQPVKKATMETGIKGIFRDSYSDFRYSSKNSSGQYIGVPALSNQYDNTQNVLSLYNSWQLSVKNWGLKAGLRLEKTIIDANFISSLTEINQDYLNLLPSVSISRTFKSKNSLTLGYSQRIQRPGIWQLNPYVDRTNPTIEQTGNPELHPVVANNFQLTYNRSGKTSFSAVLSHSFTNNAIQYIILFDPATNINRFTMSNNGVNRSTGISLNSGHPITTKWNLNLQANLNYVFVEGYLDGKLAHNDGYTGNFAMSSGYRFNHGWRANANMNYLLTPYINIQGSGVSIFFSSFSGSKDLFKEKLAVSVSVYNPFDKYMFFPNNIKGADYTILNGAKPYFRAFSYSLNYKFGKLKGAITKNKRGIDNDDVSGGSRGPQ
jgi:ferric enterobactin receptor